MNPLLHPDLLRGRRIFVSGGGSGVNLAIAKACASVGADLSICGRTQKTLDLAAEELSALGARVVTTVADVRDLEAVTAALAATEAGIGPVDGVVCGAAGNFLAPAEALSSNGFKVVVDIGVIGAFHTAKAAFEQLRATRGSVLFVSGAQAAMPFVHQAHVGAAKAGVEALMRTLAIEWGPLGIRSNSILPGPVAGTEGMERLAATAGADVWNAMVPLGRFAELAEIGTMAAVLLSPLSAYVNGAQLSVDGGMGLTGSGRFNEAVLDAVRASHQGP